MEPRCGYQNTTICKIAVDLIRFYRAITLAHFTLWGRGANAASFFTANTGIYSLLRCPFSINPTDTFLIPTVEHIRSRDTFQSTNDYNNHTLMQMTGVGLRLQGKVNERILRTTRTFF